MILFVHSLDCRLTRAALSILYIEHTPHDLSPTEDNHRFPPLHLHKLSERYEYDSCLMPHVSGPGYKSRVL